MLATAEEVRKFRGFSAEPRRGRDGRSTGGGSHLAAGRGKGHAGQDFETWRMYMRSLAQVGRLYFDCWRKVTV